MEFIGTRLTGTLRNGAAPQGPFLPLPHPSEYVSLERSLQVAPLVVSPGHARAACHPPTLPQPRLERPFSGFYDTSDKYRVLRLITPRLIAARPGGMWIRARARDVIYESAAEHRFPRAPLLFSSPPPPLSLPPPGHDRFYGRIYDTIYDTNH
jgi:hypothetical protein